MVSLALSPLVTFFSALTTFRHWKNITDYRHFAVLGSYCSFGQYVHGAHDKSAPRICKHPSKTLVEMCLRCGAFGKADVIRLRRDPGQEHLLCGLSDPLRR